MLQGTRENTGDAVSRDVASMSHPELDVGGPTVRMAMLPSTKELKEEPPNQPHTTIQGHQAASSVPSSPATGGMPRFKMWNKGDSEKSRLQPSRLPDSGSVSASSPSAAMSERVVLVSSSEAPPLHYFVSHASAADVIGADVGPVDRDQVVEVYTGPASSDNNSVRSHPIAGPQATATTKMIRPMEVATTKNVWISDAAGDLDAFVKTAPISPGRPHSPSRHSESTQRPTSPSPSNSEAVSQLAHLHLSPAPAIMSPPANRPFTGEAHARTSQSSSAMKAFRVAYDAAPTPPPRAETHRSHASSSSRDDSPRDVLAESSPRMQSSNVGTTHSGASSPQQSKNHTRAQVTSTSSGAALSSSPAVHDIVRTLNAPSPRGGGAAAAPAQGHNAKLEQAATAIGHAFETSKEGSRKLRDKSTNISVVIGFNQAPPQADLILSHEDQQVFQENTSSSGSKAWMVRSPSKKTSSHSASLTVQHAHVAESFNHTEHSPPRKSVFTIGGTPKGSFDVGHKGLLLTKRDETGGMSTGNSTGDATHGAYQQRIGGNGTNRPRDDVLRSNVNSSENSDGTTGDDSDMNPAVSPEDFGVGEAGRKQVGGRDEEYGLFVNTEHGPMHGDRVKSDSIEWKCLKKKNSALSLQWTQQAQLHIAADGLVWMQGAHTHRNPTHDIHSKTPMDRLNNVMSPSKLRRASISSLSTKKGGDKLVGHILHLVSIEAKSASRSKLDKRAKSSSELGGKQVPQIVGIVDLKMKGGKGVRLEGQNAEEIGGEIREKLEVWKRRREAQAVKLAKLVDLAHVVVDWTIPEHRVALERLWSLVYPEIEMPEPTLDINKSPGWKDMGFQSNDPCTDFRAMGTLGLHCLTYFASKYNERVRAIVRDGTPKRDFPYGAVGINICAALVDMLGMGKHGRPSPKIDKKSATLGGKHDSEKKGGGEGEAPLFEFLCRVSPLGGRVEDEAWGGYAFEETFCFAYELLDALWVKDPPENILFFNQVLKKCRTALQEIFQRNPLMSSMQALRIQGEQYAPLSAIEVPNTNAVMVSKPPLVPKVMKMRKAQSNDSCESVHDFVSEANHNNNNNTATNNNNNGNSNINKSNSAGGSPDSSGRVKPRGEGRKEEGKRDENDIAAELQQQWRNKWREDVTPDDMVLTTDDHGGRTTSSKSAPVSAAARSMSGSDDAIARITTTISTSLALSARNVSPLPDSTTESMHALAAGAVPTAAVGSSHVPTAGVGSGSVPTAGVGGTVASTSLSGRRTPRETAAAAAAAAASASASSSSCSGGGSHRDNATRRTSVEASSTTITTASHVMTPRGFAAAAAAAAAAASTSTAASSSTSTALNTNNTSKAAATRPPTPSPGILETPRSTVEPPPPPPVVILQHPPHPTPLPEPTSLPSLVRGDASPFKSSTTNSSASSSQWPTPRENISSISSPANIAAVAPHDPGSPLLSVGRIVNTSHNNNNNNSNSNSNTNGNELVKVLDSEGARAGARKTKSWGALTHNGQDVHARQDGSQEEGHPSDESFKDVCVDAGSGIWGRGAADSGEARVSGSVRRAASGFADQNAQQLISLHGAVQQYHHQGDSKYDEVAVSEGKYDEMQQQATVGPKREGHERESGTRDTDAEGRWKGESGEEDEPVSGKSAKERLWGKGKKVTTQEVAKVHEKKGPGLLKSCFCLIRDSATKPDDRKDKASLFVPPRPRKSGGVAT